MAQGGGRRSALMLVNCYCLAMIASICFLESPVLFTCADKKFVLTTCNNTDIAEQCAQIMLSDPRSVNATSVTGLVEIALDIAARIADSASSHASDLSDQYAGMPEQDALDQCIQAWAEAADDLRDSQAEVEKGNIQGAVDKSNYAIDNGDFCEKSFADKGVKSVMADLDKDASDRSALAADLLDLIYV